MILVDPSLAGIKTSADPSPGPASQDPTLLFHPPVEPGSWAIPDVESAAPEPWVPAVQMPPTQPSQPSQAQPWRPPPPPPYVKSPSQALGVASMIVGILGMLFGVLCFGPVIGIVALVLGIVALVQNKKTPQYVGGKPFAIIGIITGTLSLLIYGGLMAFFIIASNL
jgi:hypothetical protein